VAAGPPAAGPAAGIQLGRESAARRLVAATKGGSVV